VILKVIFSHPNAEIAAMALRKNSLYWKTGYEEKWIERNVMDFKNYCSRSLP
jgi:hypothetical protein